MSENGSNSTRRDWLRLASLVSAGAAAQEILPAAAPAESMYGVPFQRVEKVRMGFIGLGGRGSGLLRNFAAVDDVEVTALCDIVEDKVIRAQGGLQKLGHEKAAAHFYGNERSFEKLIAREDVDLICVATPWNWHVPMAVAAMKHGKNVAVEVPAATSIDECWQLVNTSEQTRKHCMMLENCCYGYNELLVLNMVRAGMFGDLTHGGAAYNHDLRGILFADRGEGLWRRVPHTKRNGNFYPTHGLGPVAHYMDIHHGDRFEYMVSMSSPALSLADYRSRKVPADSPKQKETYTCGDLNTSLIKTAKGRLIHLEHNVSSPQPYDRINLIAGTRGIFRDYPPRIYIDGVGKDAFGPIDPYKEKFEPPLWKRLGEIARKLGGHGGMDFLECYRLIEAMKKGEVPDMDVYDAAAWSAPGPLSEMSVAKGSAPMQFPDFTRGKWKTPRA